MPRSKRTPGDRIAELRRSKGFSQAALGWLAGLETLPFQITKPTIACRISTLRKKSPQRLRFRQNILFRGAVKKVFMTAKYRETL